MSACACLVGRGAQISATRGAKQAQRDSSDAGFLTRLKNDRITRRLALLLYLFDPPMLAFELHECCAIAPGQQ